jgi:hypothetical protein
MVYSCGVVEKRSNASIDTADAGWSFAVAGAETIPVADRVPGNVIAASLLDGTKLGALLVTLPPMFAVRPLPDKSAAVAPVSSSR